MKLERVSGNKGEWKNIRLLCIAQMCFCKNEDSLEFDLILLPIYQWQSFFPSKQYACAGFRSFKFSGYEANKEIQIINSHVCTTYTM